MSKIIESWGEVIRSLQNDSRRVRRKIPLALDNESAGKDRWTMKSAFDNMHGFLFIWDHICQMKIDVRVLISCETDFYSELGRNVMYVYTWGLWNGIAFSYKVFPQGLRRICLHSIANVFARKGVRKSDPECCSMRDENKEEMWKLRSVYH